MEFVRSMLHSMSSIAVFLGITTTACANDLFIDFNFSNMECWKLTISKSLGFAIVVGSSLVKLPQIFKIFSQSSTQGLSLTGASLELMALIMNSAYSLRRGYPWTTYAEALFLSLQTSIIGSMILFYGDASKKTARTVSRREESGSLLWAAAYLASFAAGAYFLMFDTSILSGEHLYYGQAFSIPLVILGKLTQVVTNYKLGSTGQMSAVTTVLVAAGSTARIFTSVVETGDLILILMYGTSTTVNGLLLAQLCYYWKAHVADGSRVMKKKRQ